MQTLRKRTSPCKYKNDPSRFLGEGITFKAKLIGILEVSEARGDKMCQDALNDLKTAIRAAGEHKQRITISISIDGLRLRDEKTGDCLYHHPVHKISFIAQDMSDSRAFGYIFGSPDTGHRFFGIKTDKTASQVVISMRDLFQVVFELKKKEIEMAKHHSEQHHVKYGSTGYMDSIHFPKDEGDPDKGRGKYSQLLKSRCLASKPGDPGPSEYKGAASEAIADLLDLEHELNSIQQGISQMEKITPSDPFGPLSKGEPYVDPFDDSFPSKADKPPDEKLSPAREKSGRGLGSRHPEDSDRERPPGFFPSATPGSRAPFFPQFSPGAGKPRPEEGRWFDQETESLFGDAAGVAVAEPTSSPVALTAPAPPEPDQAEGKKSPIKTDLFTELDPLGTGRVKPYVDKKDFFQELKNPPKKVLKEMVTEGSASDSNSYYFPAEFKEEKGSSAAKSDSARSSSTVDSLQGSRYGKLDPFDDGDPFDATDPFQEESFGFPSVFGTKSSIDEIFEDKLSWKFEQATPRDAPKEEKPGKSSPANLPLFSSGALRVSLPPEKGDGVGGLSLSKLRSPPRSPEESNRFRSRCYQVLKQSTAEGSEESPVHEEPFVSSRATVLGHEKRSPYKDRYYSVQSPPSGRRDRTRMYSSVDAGEATTPDPPPRAKTTLFSIKPPPLPPKKTSQPAFRPPARPPSLEDNAFHYDYLEKKESACNGVQPKDELKCVKLKRQLFTGKNSPPPAGELRKQNSDSSFPVLPPPPHRKASADGSKGNPGRKAESRGKAATGPPGSVLNLKLNQLDNTGLENLAVTLGIPSENIYSMTLQELTKMLAEKYLTLTESQAAAAEKPESDAFEVDFDANFAKMEANAQKAPPSYDKYAVFKELMESESRTSEKAQNGGERGTAEAEGDPAKEEPQGEDKYAALRQLSLNAPKPNNFGEDLDDDDDDDDDAAAAGRRLDEPPSSAIDDLDLVAGISDAKPKWQVRPADGRSGEAVEANANADADADADADEDAKAEWATPPEADASKDLRFSSDNQLFPLVDQFSDERKPTTPRDNWATFEKSDFGETPTKKASEAFNENENSPFSSDGKEDVREIPFRWHQNAFGKRTRKDVPWQDDDESWDDYSPKESFCSDESSREERSPEAPREDRYEKASWRACGRPPKSDRKWNHRDKWQEETEDEFEDTWRKQRDRPEPYEPERKNTFWHDDYGDGYKRREWCNSRSEPWDEGDRHRCYGSRRKRSESDNEYRKRCDSDASDKECAWTFQKSYLESHGKTGKQKQFYAGGGGGGGGGHSFRDCPEYCHESRAKHRKAVSQKRPSSASESKRNHEKMFPPGECAFRGPGKRDADKEDHRCQHGYKDSRHRGDPEFAHYYSSYDRRTTGHHSKGGSRTARSSGSGQGEAFPPSGKRSDAAEGKNHDLGYFEAFPERGHKHGKPESRGRFQFDSETENFERQGKSAAEQSPQDFQKPPSRRGNQWASTNGKTNGDGYFGAARTAGDAFPGFKEEFGTSPKKSSENGKPETGHAEGTKAQGKSKGHLAMLARQESSTALRKSDSINIFSRDKDPFEGDDFFSSVS